MATGVFRENGPYGRLRVMKGGPFTFLDDHGRLKGGILTGEGSQAQIDASGLEGAVLGCLGGLEGSPFARGLRP